MPLSLGRRCLTIHRSPGTEDENYTLCTNARTFIANRSGFLRCVLSTRYLIGLEWLLPLRGRDLDDSRHFETSQRFTHFWMKITRNSRKIEWSSEYTHLEHTQHSDNIIYKITTRWLLYIHIHWTSYMYRCLDALDEFYRSIFEKECIMFKCPDSSGLILYYGNLYTFLLWFLL